MKKMDRKGITMPLEEIVYWGRAALVLVIILLLFYFFWDKLNNWIGYVGGFR